MGLLRIQSTECGRLGLLIGSLILQVYALCPSQGLTEQRAHLVLAVRLSTIAHTAILVRLRSPLLDVQHLVTQIDQHVLRRLRVRAIRSSATEQLADATRGSLGTGSILASVGSRVHAGDDLWLARLSRLKLFELGTLQERSILGILVRSSSALLAELLDRLYEVVQVLELILLPLVVHRLILRTGLHGLTGS